MAGKNVCVLGASGAVGQQMIQCLEEADFPIENLTLLASASSAGTVAKFKGEDITIQETKDGCFDGIDIVLSAVENPVAKAWLPKAVEAGATVVDNSSAYRLQDDVPLVIADVNPEDIEKNNGIIANPNCATIIALLALAPLHKKATIKRIVCSTYQAASGAGMPGINELLAQQKAIAEGREVDAPKAFVDQLAMNLIPDIGGIGENLYTSEEMKMQNEGRKILHHPELRVNCTCVRVPIARSHSESITVEFEEEMTPELARELLGAADGVKVIDDVKSDNAQERYPMPLYTSDQDLVYVGRIREDISALDPKKSLTLWCTGDQIRIGAATNAVKIAQHLV
ncbi:MAG: aspartate-semialdehyde dehydrogenase [Phoenicibacter congonensis]|uniref:Aspartate-semialdehyde dehydrogenase n=1 Tax=Phoenicibacter congonensis TaxID=1944646 RepID=A0AA43RIL9_9ACTN|nr:aspartate-semialdehyde dehydrogenase [Phoenicibacter congonensis]